MKSHMGGLRRSFMNNHLITTEQEGQSVSSDAEENIIHWVTFF